MHAEVEAALALGSAAARVAGVSGTTCSGDTTLLQGVSAGVGPAVTATSDVS